MSAQGSNHAVAGRTVVVTGAGGFIGSVVVRHLTSLGATVRALLGPVGATVVQPPPEVRAAYGAIDDAVVLRDLVAHADVVIHLAGLPSVAASFNEPAEYAKVNVVGTATLLDAIRGSGVGRLVHISSAELYAQPTSKPVTEDDRVEPRSPYGAAKLGAEWMVRSMAPVLDLEVAILRPFSVYGPGSPPRSLIGLVIHQALHASAVTVADLTPVRDYCFVDDLAEAIVAACTQPLSEPTRTFNIGSGVGVSVAELIQVVVACAGREIPVVAAPSADRPVSATVASLIADPERAAAELGWRTSTSLKTGVARTVASTQEREAAGA